MCMKTLNDRFDGRRDGGEPRRPGVETAGLEILPRNLWGRRGNSNRVEPVFEIRGHRLLACVGFLLLAGCAVWRFGRWCVSRQGGLH